MKPVYLSLDEWQTVQKCVEQASDLLLEQSGDAQYKEARDILFALSEGRKRLAENILNQLAD